MDKFEKQTVIRAPVSRVWRALTDSAQFSAWFGVILHGEFSPGKTITGTFGGEFNEAKIMEYQKQLGITPSRIRKPEPKVTFCTVEAMEPERYFSYRWIPYGIDAEADPKNEPTTLVEFRLEEVDGGTKLTITESGFDKVPAHRRERAFRMNEGGWAAQAESVRKYVEAQ